MQLVAYGAQDVYLTGNPQITFFKVVYRRHTNFSMESIEQTFNGNPNFGKKVSCTISRNGDLIHRVYLQTTLPKLTEDCSGASDWVNWVGHTLIKNVEVEIGGQRVDKHYGEWLHLWNELTQQPGQQTGYARMVGNVPALTASGGTVADPTTLYIPLQFWFCRNPGLALPLIALQYHEVKINVEFNDLSKLVKDVEPKNNACELSDTALWVDYIYLDTDERRRFAQVSHEYLIEQLQFTGEESISNVNSKIKLNFNHPVKELVWVVQKATNAEEKQWTNFSDLKDSSFTTGETADPLGVGMDGPVDLNELTGFNLAAPDGANCVDTAKLQLNGHDRFQERKGDYFNYVQPYQHHTNTPAVGVNVYSFGLKPEEHQPSGTCNFSRIDNAVLQLTVTDQTLKTEDDTPKDTTAKVRVYATNYNVLRIMSGMGGLAYSN